MQTLLTPIRYVFYRLLVYKLRDPGETTPVFVASLATTTLLLFNVMSATMVVNHVAGRRDLLPSLNNWTSYVVVAAIEMLGYLLIRSSWVDNGNYGRLTTEFRSRGPSGDAMRTVLFWSYLCLTVALPIGLAVLLPNTSPAMSIRP